MSSTGNGTGWVSGRTFRRLAVATVVMTYFTILLGVATKAAGAGLACQARWPVCDGGLLNLFPTTVPSFFEWIHRVVAGTTGFFILGTAVAAWRGDHGRWLPRFALLGLALLPVQVLLGRQTVLQFTMPILTAHYWVAMTIFGSFVAVAALSYRSRLTRGHLRRALAVALAAVPVQLLFSAQMLSRYSPPIQSAHYAATLVLLAALVVAVVAARERLSSGDTVRTLAQAALVVVPVQILLGRQALITFSSTLKNAHAVAVGLLFVLLAVALVRCYRSEERPTARSSVEH